MKHFAELHMNYCSTFGLLNTLKQKLNISAEPQESLELAFVSQTYIIYSNDPFFLSALYSFIIIHDISADKKFLWKFTWTNCFIYFNRTK